MRVLNSRETSAEASRMVSLSGSPSMIGSFSILILILGRLRTLEQGWDVEKAKETFVVSWAGPDNVADMIFY